MIGGLRTTHRWIWLALAIALVITIGFSLVPLAVTFGFMA